MLRLITFRVGAETFVLDIMAVRQIVPYSGTTSVPTAPAFVEGIMVLRNEGIPIIALRGGQRAPPQACAAGLVVPRNEVLPVIALRERLYPHSQHGAQPLVLITHTSAGAVGLKAAEVRRIVTAP